MRQMSCMPVTMPHHVTPIVQTQHACLTKHRAVERRCYANAVSQSQVGGPTALQDAGQAYNPSWQQTQTSQQANNNVECLLAAVKQKEMLTACQLDKLVYALSLSDNQSQLHTCWGDLIDFFHMCEYTPPKGFLLQLDRAILKLCTSGVKRVYTASQSQTTAFMAMLTTDIQRHCDVKEQPPIYTFPLLLESRWNQKDEKEDVLPYIPYDDDDYADHYADDDDDDDDNDDGDDDDVDAAAAAAAFGGPFDNYEDHDDGGKTLNGIRSSQDVTALLSNYWSAMQNAVHVSGKPFDWPFDQTKCLISAQASEPIIRRCSPLWGNQFVLAHNVISDILTFKELDEFAWSHSSDRRSMLDVSKCLVQSLQLLRRQLQDLDRQRHSRGARETAESGSDESDTVMRQCRQAWNLALHTLKLFLNWQYTHLAQAFWGEKPVEELLGLLCDASMLDPELVLDPKTCKDLCCDFVGTNRSLLYAMILVARQPDAWESDQYLYVQLPDFLILNLRPSVDMFEFDTLELIMLLKALGATFRMTGHPQDGPGDWDSHGTMCRVWENLHLPYGEEGAMGTGLWEGHPGLTTWNTSENRTLNHRISFRIAQGLACATPEERMYLMAKIGLV